MNNMPPSLRKELAADPEYSRCSLLGYHECGGRITFEHALIYAGKQIQRRFAIIPVCAAGQEVDEYQDSGRMDKDMNKWVALSRATEDDFREFSRANYPQALRYLNSKFGVYVPPAIPKV